MQHTTKFCYYIYLYEKLCIGWSQLDLQIINFLDESM